MLTVMQLPEGQRYFRTKVSVTGAELTTVFTPWFGPFSPTSGNESFPSLLSSTDGWISANGTKDIAGDRPCEHRQISGMVTMLPFKPASGSIVDTLFEHHYVDLGNGYVSDFTHLMHSGTFFYYVFTGASGTERHFVAKNHGAGRWTYGNGTKIPGKAFSGNLYQYLMLSSGRYRTLTQYNVSLNAFKEGTYSTPQAATTYTKDILKPVTRSVDASAVARQLGIFHNSKEHHLFLPTLVEEVPNVYGDMVQDCIDQTRDVDTNTLSFVSELRDIAKLLPKLPLGDDALNPKAWANLYLVWQYGLKLTAQDLRLLGSALISASKDASTYVDKTQVLYAKRAAQGKMSDMAYTDTYHYKVTLQPLDVPGMEFVRRLDAWGLYPTPERLWDMVPFSFVVDWFISIGDWLNQVDLDLMSGYYRVLAVCWSRKVELDYPVSRMFPTDMASGYITLTHYVRRTSKKLHPIQFRLEKAGQFRNWAEALALVIVNRK